METPRCPPREELERLLDEELPPADMRRVSAHVAACAECQRTLESLTSDSAVDCPSWHDLREPDPDTPRNDFLDRIKQAPLFPGPRPDVVDASDANEPTEPIRIPRKGQ